MNRAPIGLFYGSSTCYTEIVAEKIVKLLGNSLVDIFNIADEPFVYSQFYNHLILGIPTWDYGELQEDWEEIWDDIDELDFTGKKVAIYGLGDQLGYPEWFLDAMGYLHHKLIKLGAEPIGYWPNQGYQYEQSKALTAKHDFFVGLALDDENQFDLTDARLNAWCQQLLREFGLTDHG